MSEVGPRWLVLLWGLLTESSTPRVTVWRAARRLGARGLTRGAVVLPFREDLQEQLDWIAQEVAEQGGVAWVLPVTQLSEVEEASLRELMQADREAEYRQLAAQAQAFLSRAPQQSMGEAQAGRINIDKQLLALQRRFRKIRARDYFGAPGRTEAAAAIDRCLAYRQGISAKITAATDDHPD